MEPTKRTKIASIKTIKQRKAKVTKSVDAANTKKDALRKLNDGQTGSDDKRKKISSDEDSPKKQGPIRDSQMKGKSGAPAKRSKIATIVNSVLDSITGKKTKNSPDKDGARKNNAKQLRTPTKPTKHINTRSAAKHINTRSDGGDINEKKRKKLRPVKKENIQVKKILRESLSQRKGEQLIKKIIILGGYSA